MQDTVTTVFIVDDDASVRTSLERLLRASSFHVESYASAEEFLQRKPYNGIGVVILDIKMPGLNGMELQSQLLGLHFRIPIVFLSGHGDIPTSVIAMKRGAVNFLTKPVDETQLICAVKEGLWRHKQILDAINKSEKIRAKIKTLTDREHEIMRYVISGALNKHIANELGISEKTVKVHRGRMLEKMNITSVAELVRMCAEVDEAPLHINQKEQLTTSTK